MAPVSKIRQYDWSGVLQHYSELDFDSKSTYILIKFWSILKRLIAVQIYLYSSLNSGGIAQVSSTWLQISIYGDISGQSEWRMQEFRSETFARHDSK